MNVLCKILLALTALSMSLSACKHKGGTDPYYTDHGEWDDVRFPVIKPYEALKLNGDHQEWIVQLTQDQDRLFSIPGTKEINVIDGVVFVHATKTILDYAEIDEAWFILIPAKHLEKGFASHFAYQDYVHYLGLRNEPKLYSMNSVSQYFGNRDTIDWKRIDE